MQKERSAGAMIFRVERGKPLYLLLHYPSSAKSKKEYWDLPKGHMEKGESEEDTVRREIEEETGLKDIELFDGFLEEIRYWFQWKGEKISKTVVFYLAKTHEKKVTISQEHLGFQWSEYEEAGRKLTYANAKRVLRKAHQFLKKRRVI